MQDARWLRSTRARTHALTPTARSLKVPHGCATLRVGNETRSWVEGEVIVFDDSFEHEVRSRCREERVIFQVVVLHPDLWKRSTALDNMKRAYTAAEHEDGAGQLSVSQFHGDSRDEL